MKMQENVKIFLLNYQSGGGSYNRINTRIMCLLQNRKPQWLCRKPGAQCTKCYDKLLCVLVIRGFMLALLLVPTPQSPCSPIHLGSVSRHAEEFLSIRRKQQALPLECQILRGQTQRHTFALWHG